MPTGLTPMPTRDTKAVVAKNATTELLSNSLVMNILDRCLEKNNRRQYGQIPEGKDNIVKMLRT